MVMIDDATEPRQTRASSRTRRRWRRWTLFGQYVRRHGLPRALYVDRDSIYRTDREVTQAEALAGQEPKTQFGRAMEELGVELILLAGSPAGQGPSGAPSRHAPGSPGEGVAAAGRSTTSPRPIGSWSGPSCPTSTAASRCRPPSLPTCIAACRRGLSWSAVLAMHHARQVQNDGTVRWENRWLQVAARHRSLGLAGRRVTVCQQLEGQLLLLYAGRVLSWKELPGPPAKALPPRSPPAGEARPPRSRATRRPLSTPGVAGGPPRPVAHTRGQ